MKRALVFAAALAASGAVQAAGVGVRVGTTGLGIDLAKNILPTLDARVGYSGGSIGYDSSTSGASYSGDVKLSNLSALLDFHPLGPLFRISGGVIFNRNKYEASGAPASGPGSFNATVESGRSAAPYLGIGWGNVAGAGINFYADLGVMFMGTPKASITANCSGLSGPQCTALQGQVANEQQNLQDKLDRFKAFPVLNIGLSIGF
jgi:hypothetical protein